MKLTLAVSLLLGYVMLVPVCFFGGMLWMNPDTMNMIGNPAHQMDDCGMPLDECAHSMNGNSMDSVAHHIGMYNSITQTPLNALSIIMLAVVASLLLLFGLSYNWLDILLSQISLRPLVRRVDEPRSKTRQNILTWLSLFETSPNFA